MIAKHVSINELVQVANSVGVRLESVRTVGRRVQFVLRLKADRKYGRRGHTGRRVAAVCWHGHRDYFRALFELQPLAMVQSRATRSGIGWYTAENFEQVYQQTDTNIGSMYRPMTYSDACDCNVNLGDPYSGNRPIVRVMRQADLLKCPHVIIDLDHYRQDDTCKCNDPVEQARMIAECGYSESDFK